MRQVPNDDEFEHALRVIQLRDEGETYAVINNKTGVSEGTFSNILDRRDQYLNDAEAHRINPDPDVVTA